VLVQLTSIDPPGNALQEIIELSCVLVDTASCALLPASFQRYVRPDQHPALSAFCTELTGISQGM
jgi:ERI1 exoribonuclease 2